MQNAEQLDLSFLAEIDDGSTITEPSLNEGVSFSSPTPVVEVETQPEEEKAAPTAKSSKKKKVWVAVNSTSGESVEVNNMRTFCNEKDLNYSKIVTGKVDKGWSAKRTDK